MAKSDQKIRDWKEKSKQTLEHEVSSLQEKLRSLRFLLASGKLKNVRDIQKNKKDIARILTIIKSSPKAEK
ncbi:MAG: 50S ribosomal protein L29 [bacterium]|nr:50S ribosomal protein L29 [bacterium]